MKNTIINRKVVLKVAQALGALNKKVVYVGGAVISMYIDDPAAEDVRPTKDIDIVLEIASLGELEELRQTLVDKGFSQTHEDDVICRFRYEDLKVDVMSTRAIGWAPANPWFARGFTLSQSIDLDGITIRVMPLPFFLASKFSAFESRGGIDPRTSYDFEDIVYILNYRTNIKEEILNSEEDVKTYLISCFNRVLSEPALQEAVVAHLYYEHQQQRHSRIMSSLKSIVE